MDLSKINKKYIVGFVVFCLVLLVSVTIIQPGTLKRQDTTDYAQLNARLEYEKKQYEALLADVHPDYESSQDYLEKVVTKETVEDELERNLQTKRNFVIPTIADSEIKISNRKDTDAVANYLNDVGSMVMNHGESLAGYTSALFKVASDASAANESKEETDKLLQSLRGEEVPVDAVGLHKSLLVSYTKLSQMLTEAQNFTKDEESIQWANIYEQYVVIDKMMVNGKKQLLELTKTYALEDMTIMVASSALFKTAQAGWPVIDILQEAWRAYGQILSAVFAQFYIKLTDKMLKAVEKGFSIASQLYYSNALGRHYSIEFFKKFVENPLDQEVLSQFLPEYFCKPKDEEFLRNVYIAKAKLNAAPNLVFDPADPNFLEKSADLLADPKNNTLYHEDFYNTLAGLTKANASSSSSKEVSSDGLKSGRAQSADGDIVGVTIQKTMASLRDAQHSIFEQILNLGAGNPDDIASKIVGSVITTIINKFVFVPAGGGDLQVYKETQKCLQIPKINPIVPISDPGYGAPEQGPLPTTSQPPQFR